MSSPVASPAEVVAERLRLEVGVRAACEAAGHLLHGFRPDRLRQSSLSSACCARCGRGVRVDVRPAAGEVSVSGSAVGSGCREVAS